MAAFFVSCAFLLQIRQDQLGYLEVDDEAGTVHQGSDEGGGDHRRVDAKATQHHGYHRGDSGAPEHVDILPHLSASRHRRGIPITG